MNSNLALGLALLLSLGASGACSSGGDDGGDDDGDNGGAGTPSGAGNSGAGSGGNTGGSGNTGGGAAPSGGSSAAGSSAAGAPAGGSGSSEFSCVNQGEINLDCPFNLPPIDGTCAPTGDCCRRASNNAKIDALGPDESAQIEYRLNYVDVINHPQTLGHPTLVMAAQARGNICSGEQCLLWRFTAPRMGGEFVAGDAEVEVGIGAYNCDGTYSFYGPNAAPDRTMEIGQKDPGRWQAVTVPAKFDPAKEGIEQFHIPWATNRNREIARSIFLEPADGSIDWELSSSGFEMTGFDTSEAGRDCMGARDGFDWASVGGFISFSPIEGNDQDVSNIVMEKYCQVLAFGVIADKTLSCTETARCMPGSADCPWLKLPDALCPTDDAQRAMWGCHLGAEGNPNGEEGYPAALDCTPDEPTAALNPDMGATSKGQCCDPMGASASLPACNAYRTVQVYVAGAAEITDEPINKLAPVCGD